MSLEHRLEPRDVLPYTDDEIRELFLRAQIDKMKEVRPITESSQLRTPDDRLRWTNLQIFLTVVTFYTAVLLVLQVLLGTQEALTISVLIFTLEVLVVVKLYRRPSLTPAQILEQKDRKPHAMRTFRRIDPSNPDVLRKVVGFVAYEPLAQEARIEESIRESLGRVQSSLQELPQLAHALNLEVQQVHDEGMLMLLASKKEAAAKTIMRLEQIRGQLQSQLDEAKEAIRPIQDLLQRFENLQRLSTSLSRIQAAHGLVEESQEKIEDHRLQLNLLWAVSATASARLKEIQTIVEAQEKAEAEIDFGR